MTLPKPERDWDRIIISVVLAIIGAAILLGWLVGCTALGSIFSIGSDSDQPPPIPADAPWWVWTVWAFDKLAEAARETWIFFAVVAYRKVDQRRQRCKGVNPYDKKP